MSRLAVVRALEAAEVSDYRLVVDILLALLDELDEGPVVYRRACKACGQRFEWPGLLDGHLAWGCPTTTGIGRSW